MTTPPTRAQVEAMSQPVRCLCGGIYDLGTVQVTQRYADCSMWKAPCCGRVSDDRTWKSLPDFQRIALGGPPADGRYWP